MNYNKPSLYFLPIVEEKLAQAPKIFTVRTSRQLISEREPEELEEASSERKDEYEV